MIRSLCAALFFLASALSAQDWPQWGRTAQHDGLTPAVALPLGRIEAQMVIDPFVPAEKAVTGGFLTIHYPVPLVDGNDLFLLEKGGTLPEGEVETRRWSVKEMRRTAAGFVKIWTFTSDWVPVPYGLSGGGPQWEPVFHPALSGDVVWVPGAGGTLFKVRRSDGTAIARVNPFGVAVVANIFTVGPPAVDAAGNVFYDALQLNPSMPWTSDPPGAWLVRVGADGTTSLASYASLVPNAPAASAQCTAAFSQQSAALPPSRDAVAPTIRCGAQRPSANAGPAIAADGTVYTVSRAHINDRYSFLVAVNNDLTPKWAASLRNRFLDGCNAGLPPNGTPGGCRADAKDGVDPTDNLAGSGRVIEDSTSSPVVLPDGSVLYGSYNRYNYAQGHLMKFSAAGEYLAAYRFGWDITPSIYRHDGTYSIVLKENRYDTGSYCNRSDVCPPRSVSAPNDPPMFFITQLDPSLNVQWQFRNTETRACTRVGNDIRCVFEGDDGFEWCVNALAIDGAGTVYANSEDGNVYAIGQGGILRERIFLDSAIGASYTPLSIGADGRIYTQNNGLLFVIGASPRRRAVGR